MAPLASWVANKVILAAASLLLGAFFVNWVADHPLLWQGPDPSPVAVATALRYYSHIYHAPPFFVTTLTSVAGIAVGAAIVKLVINPVAGMLFDGATLLLLLSATSVYSANALAALRYLPLDKLVPGTPEAKAILEKIASGGTGKNALLLEDVRLVEALQSIAASHMIIAVSLTGVLALQAAQSFADGPTTAGSPDKLPNSAGVAVPASTAAPIPVDGEESEED
ncbi:hypothetical protein JCM8097_001769 [Rhodosporidiobolus ruineniae]